PMYTTPFAVTGADVALTCVDQTVAPLAQSRATSDSDASGIYTWEPSRAAAPDGGAASVIIQVSSSGKSAANGGGGGRRLTFCAASRASGHTSAAGSPSAPTTRTPQNF